MIHNKRKNAALLLRLLSIKRTYSPAKHIIYFMPKLLTSFLLVFLSISAFGNCTFPELGDGSSCDMPLPLCGSNVAGSLPSPDGGSDLPDLCNAGTIENPVWYEFIACESTVTLEICPGTCSIEGTLGTGIQASIASGCSNDTYVVCDVDPNDMCFELSASSFIPGETYYLIVDGYSGSVCDFTINIVEGVYDGVFDLNGDQNPEISHTPIDECMEEGELINFSVSDCIVTGGTCIIPTLLSSDYVCYEWTFDPPTVAITPPDNLSSIEVEFLEEGIYTVSVERKFHPILEECGQGTCPDPLAITVDINFITTITEPTQFICPGETVNICGNPVGINGTYECLDEDSCILTISEIEFVEQDEQDLGVIYLCPDECYTLEGVDYCERDIFEIQSDSNCGILYTFELRDLFIDIQEPSYPILDCFGGEELVNMTVTTNYENGLSYSFIDEDGVEISQDFFALISEPGDYVFYVFSEDFIETCIDSIEFTIEIDDTPPMFTLDAEVLTCTEKEASLTINEIDELISFEWTGPAVQNGTQETAFATEPGWYYVEGIGASGCAGYDSIEVEEVLLPADISIDFDNLTCELAMTTLQIISDVVIDSVVWTGPADYASKELSPMVSDTGTYIALMHSTNGCDYTEIIKILGFYDEPEFNVEQNELWLCDTESLVLGSTILSGNDVSYEWSTKEGEISSGVNNSSVTIGSNGTYYLEVTDGENGCSFIDTFVVNTDPNVPSGIEFELTNPSCFGVNDGIIEIVEIEGGVGPFDFILDETMTSESVISNLSASAYAFTLIDANGCELDRTITLVSPDELLAEVEGPEDAVFDESITLTSIYDATEIDLDVVNWYNTAGELIGTGDMVNHIMKMNELFTMELIDINGCIVTRTKPVILDTDYDYYQPNTFTPNDDGFNDYFRIFSQKIPGEVKEFAIYDRWGNRVFALKEPVTLPNDDDQWGWDGTINGQRASQGVYTYFAIVETLGVTKELIGSVTLVR